MNTKNYTTASLFLLLFFGIIGLTSCEKEEEIKKTESIVIIDKDGTGSDDSDSIPIVITDYEKEIITSNWSELQEQDVGGIDIDFFDNDFGIVASVGSLRITYDGGQTWETKTSTSIDNFHKIQVIDIDKFYFAGREIYKSKNGGNSTRRVDNLDSLIGLVTDFHFIDSLHYVISYGDFSHYKVESTSDGGLNWNTIVENKRNSISEYHIQFVDDEIGYIAGQKIYKTNDKGENWTLLNTTKTSSNITTCMYFLNKDIGYIADNDSYIHKTIDGGQTWETISQILYDFRIDDILFVDEQVGYIASYNGVIFRTEDAGLSWKVDYFLGKNPSYYNYEQRYFSLSKTPNNTVYVTGATTMKRK